MCGIIGYYGRPRKGTSLEAGLACLSHRGPDDHGTYFAEAGDRSVGLGHARLSIIDLSLQGHQPMRSADGKRQIVFNGEIYNYRALRGELESEGCTFRSHSDTEVLLEGYGRWGDGVLHRLRGMFAFAIWEEDTRTLFLARDRLGVKPLYVAQTPDGLWFSSEVRALLAAGAVPRRLSIPGVSSYLHFGSVAGPLTIIEGVTELGAGTSVRFDGENSVARTYWSLPVFHGHRPEEELRSILLESIRLRLEADVPVGIFLSSGIDSAVVAKLAKAASTKPVHTFTVVFDARPDEGRGAADVARELGTVHHEALLRSDDIAERVVGALAFQDQPSVDGINTFFVSAAVRATGLKVALSGLGGDELFAGYESFRDIPRLLAIGRKLPHLSQEAREKIERAFFPHLSSGRARKLLDLALVMDRPSAIYRASRALFSPPQVERLLGLRPLDSSEIDRAVDDGVRGGSIDAVNGYGLLELRYYTRNTLLRDTDVMSMAHGLEVREPLLDHELVEVAFGIDGYRKLSRRPNKRLLVDAAGGIPHAVSQRRKRGFELPFEPWMRGPLREWVDNRIESARPPLHLEAVRAVYRDFQDQRMSWSRVFALVALVDWCERHQVT